MLHEMRIKIKFMFVDMRGAPTITTTIQIFEVTSNLNMWRFGVVPCRSTNEGSGFVENDQSQVLKMASRTTLFLRKTTHANCATGTYIFKMLIRRKFSCFGLFVIVKSTKSGYYP